SLSVKNNTAFSGGQDAYTDTIVKQSDIDGAANPLKGPLMQTALSSPNFKRQPGEQYLPGQPHCDTTVTSNPAANAVAPNKTVTVTVTMKCTGEIYDQRGAQSIASNLLKGEASKNLGTDYALAGDVVTNVTSAT